MRNTESYRQYREARVRQGKTVNWEHVKSMLRYRQNARDLERAGFMRVNAFSSLPWESPNIGWRVVEARVGVDGKSLWARVENVRGT